MRSLTKMLLVGAFLGSTVVAATAQAEIRFKGVITAVGDRSVTFDTRHDEVTVGVNEDTRIIRNGRRAELGDLQVGDRAKVLARETDQGLLALAIRARGEGSGDVVRLRGVIQAVERGLVVLRTRRGPAEIHVTDETRIMRNGEPAELGDLRRGDRAKVLARRTDRGLLGLKIMARGRG